MTYHALDLHPRRQSPTTRGLGRLISRPETPLCPHGGLYLVTPTGWAAVVEASRRFPSALPSSMPRGMDGYTTVTRIRAATATCPELVRADGWLRYHWGGQPDPHPCTEVLVGNVAALDDLGRRLCHIPYRPLRALCTSVLQSRGTEQLPHAGSAWGRPWDIPGGWVHRARDIIAELTRFSPSLVGLPLALAQAAVLLSDQPVRVAPDPDRTTERTPDPRGNPAAALEHATATLAHLAPAFDLRETVRLRLLHLMTGLIADEEGDDLGSDDHETRLTTAVRQVRARWQSFRESIIVA